MKTKELIRPMPATWWLHNRHLVKFVIREVTSFFVAGYAIFLLVVIYQVNRGGAEFHQFYSHVLQSGWVKAYGWISLIFVAFHSITSFDAAPTIMAPRWGEDKIDPRIIIVANYGLWLIVSIAILIIVL
jgi:fumarate reductase subunit C